MINVLFYAEELSIGGVEKMMLQWIEHKTADIHIDLCVRKILCEEYHKQLISLGCTVYEINCGVKNIPQKAKYLKQLFSQIKYDIVHVHTSMATDFFILAIAKKFGIKHRIAHSHNVPVIPKKTTRYADKVCKPLLRYFTTDYFACSKQSAIALFGDDKKTEEYRIIKNGVDIEFFKFSMQNRIEVRKEFGIEEDSYVIGSVGRLDFQKNYGYLMNVLSKTNIPPEKLTVLIIGDGEERNDLQKTAHANNINLLLPGKRNDVNKILSAMDLFVLTSRYEGFPVVMMEAQSNGLTCYVTEAIPPEAIFESESIRIPLSDKKKWGYSIEQFFNSPLKNYVERSDGYNIVMDAGYDIKRCAESVVNIYKKMCSV